MVFFMLTVFAIKIEISFYLGSDATMKKSREYRERHPRPVQTVREIADSL
jgi:hypothetical protein